MKTGYVQVLAKKSLQFVWGLTKGSCWDWSPPYEYVFEITAERVHDYIGIPKYSISKWCIVGGYLGLEVPRLLNNYPNVTIDVFEC